jgi:hypothetical protein
LKYYLGAYALSPTKKGWDAGIETAFYDDLKQQQNLKGLEHPFYGSLHEHDDDWFLANIAPHWDYVLTCIPGTMNALALNPHFGIASDNAEGRAAALAFMQSACSAVGKLNRFLGRQAVTAVQVHTAPARRHAGSSKSALIASLRTMAAWDWQGASIVIEHCDAYVDNHVPSKGFLALDDELDVLSELNQGLSVPMGMVINWGRSVFETRRTQGALAHIVAARQRDLLRGIIFSGISDQMTAYGAWRDSHMPATPSERVILGAQHSWMTEALMHECLAASGDAQALPIVGAKISIRPDASSKAERMGYITDTLAILDRYFSREV